MTITNELLGELEAKAKAASGDLIKPHGFGTFVTDVDVLAAGDACQDAANPATILALVEHIRSQAAELENSRAALAMHDKIERETHAELERCKAGQEVPDGWKLVPAVPTQEQNDAGRAVLAGGAVPMAKVYRAMLAAAPAAPAQVAQDASEEAAYQIGAKGAEPSEAERLLFEAWMRGHCWAVVGEWNGKTYVAAEEDGRRVNQHAMLTRQLWAAWRDRAAISCHSAPPAADQPDSVKVPRELLERHLDEIGEYAWDTYDELRALLGKDGEA